MPAKTPPLEHRDVFLVILDLHQWEAISYEWWSPTWQNLAFPKACGRWHESIRAVCGKGDDWKPLLETAARAGFWTLDKDSSLKPIAVACGLELMEGSSVFETAFQLVKHCLNCSDQECVSIMQLRAAMMDEHESACLDALLEMGECIGMMDKAEAESMRKEQAQAKVNKADYHECIAAYRKNTTGVSSPQGCQRQRSRQSKCQFIIFKRVTRS